MCRIRISFVTIVVFACLVTAACSSPSPSTPTQAPAKAAEPTKAPAAAPTKATEPTKAATPAAAQPTVAPAAKVSFPEKGKTITIMCGFPAGGSNDIFSRILAEPLEKELGIPVQVVNKPGAAGQIGVTEGLKAKPDGYTLIINSLQSTITFYMEPERKFPFTRKDFQPVSAALMDPAGFVVKADSRFKTVKDLVDAAKAASETIKLGDNGVLSSTHMASLALEQFAKVKFAAVHFDGNPGNFAAVLGGHIDAGIFISPGLTGQFQAGEVISPGVFGKTENAAYPGGKPLPAQGYDVTWVRTLSLDVPAGTPKEIVTILDKTIEKIAGQSAYQKKLQDAGMTPAYMDTAKYAAHWDEQEKIMKVILEGFKASEGKK